MLFDNTNACYRDYSEEEDEWEEWTEEDEDIYLENIVFLTNRIADLEEELVQAEDLIQNAATYFFSVLPHYQGLGANN